MGRPTPITVLSSTLGRLAAILLVVLIVSPFTAPFSVKSGDIQASPSGPADSLQNESMQAPAVVEEVALVHVELSPRIVTFRGLDSVTIVEFAQVNQILRL